VIYEQYEAMKIFLKIFQQKHLHFIILSTIFVLIKTEMIKTALNKAWWWHNE